MSLGRDRHGRLRLQGPARRLAIRCPNYGPSMRLSPSKYDPSGCVEGDGCSCGITITVTDDLQERMRQPHVWMTSAWAAAYYRRNLVEALNSWVKFHRNLRRGSIRVATGPRVRTYFYLWLVGSLIAQVRNWRQGDNQPLPAVLVDDHDDDGRAGRAARRSHAHGAQPPEADTGGPPSGLAGRRRARTRPRR